jgi:hypothetical protein
MKPDASSPTQFPLLKTPDLEVFVGEIVVGIKGSWFMRRWINSL